jgi:phosphatidylinositol alpha-1,6-mannosyltransferase
VTIASAARLAVVTNDYPPKPGGIQQYLGNLVDAYPGDVLVLAPADGPADATRRGEGVVRRSDRRFMWPTPAVGDWVVAQLAEFEPQSVLFGAPHPLPKLTDRLRSATRAPIGVLCHGAEVTIPAAVPGVRQGLGSMLAAADIRFAVSRYTARRVERLSGQSVTYIGGGVDLDRFAPLERSRNGPLVVGCVSRFVPRKGQHRLIDAAAQARAAGVDLEVLLVGKGRMEAELRRRAIASDVPVRFAVDVPWAALPDLYAEMDVFCMPCRTRWGGLEVEGLGLVFLEAAAAGLPVLAGDSGGSPETVVPGETGYVVHTVADIAHAIQMFAADPAEMRRMGEAGRARVEAEFAWSAVTARLVAGFAAVRNRLSGLDSPGNVS